MGQRGRSLFARGVFGAALVGVAILATACNDGGQPARGFGSRQVRALRDSTFVFNGYAPNVAYYNTGFRPGDASALAYFAIHFATDEVEDLGHTFGEPTPPPGQIYRCSQGYREDGTVLTITDVRSGDATVIDRIYSHVPYCPADDDPSLVVWRRDEAKNVTLWMGPYDRLEPIALPLVVKGIARWAERGRVVTLLAARPDAPEALGLYVLDLASLAIDELLAPAATATAWAPGATPDGPLDSTSLGGNVESIGSYFGYTRVMSDGRRTFFVGPFPSEPERELALFRIDPADVGTRISIQVLKAGIYRPDPVWRFNDPVDGAPKLFYWQYASRRLITCPLPIGFISSGLTYPDGDHVFFFPSSSNGNGPGGPVVMLSLDPTGGGNCTTLADDVIAFLPSASGNAIGWLEAAPGGLDRILWAAAGDGSGARVIGTGEIDGPPNAPRFTSDFELELTLDGDLVSVDVRDDPVRLHYIAERVWGNVRDLGHFLVANVERSTQDGTGRLVLIDRRTGDKRLFSPEVAEHMTLTAMDESAPGVWVAYLVRGRNPSPQDGVWIAKIAEDDLR